MGLIDKFKDLINVPDDDIYDDDFGFEENADQQDISSSRESTRSREYDRPREHSRERDYSREDSKRNKFVNIHVAGGLILEAIYNKHKIGILVDMDWFTVPSYSDICRIIVWTYAKRVCIWSYSYMLTVSVKYLKM